MKIESYAVEVVGGYRFRAYISDVGAVLMYDPEWEIAPSLYDDPEIIEEAQRVLNGRCGRYFGSFELPDDKVKDVIDRGKTYNQAKKELRPQLQS